MAYYITARGRDKEYVAAYLETKSQVKAAEICGVSRETIARAVRRAGIPLNGRRNNGDHKGNYGGGSPRKITDKELIEESKTMTRNEIASKHNMHVCNVDRKLKRLGIKCAPASHNSNRSHITTEWHFVETHSRTVKNMHPEFEYLMSKGCKMRLRCKQCGKIIERDKSTVRRYVTTCERCENECRLQEARQKLIGLLVAIEGAKTPRVCPVCGKEFCSPVPNKKYCSEKCKEKTKRRSSDYRDRCRRYGVYYDPEVTRMKVIKRDHGICQICGKKCNPKDKRWGYSGPDFPTVDHIIPLAKGGTHTWNNVQCACAMCNSTKRDLLEEEGA